MRAAVTAGVVLVAVSAGAPVARAAWSAPDIVSVDDARQEQGDSATTNVDLSADARFTVFQTRATNFFADDDPDPPGASRLGGIFRHQQGSGDAPSLVADGDVVGPGGAVLIRGAANPSVSADGRFVVFQTAQKLVPQDTNGAVDVYVRDMDKPVGADRVASGAYALVDARDGGDVPASYDPPAAAVPGGNPGAGVAPGVAISSDGRFVAFRTTETASDLPDRAKRDTPAGTVFVRDLQAKRTVLVSRRMSDGAAVGGSAAGVAISGDGSTVSWTTQNATQQTRFLPGEVPDDQAFFYLWRRWDDAGAQTRRITGRSDPDDPDCGGGTVSLSSSATGPCEGPLTDTEQGNNSIQGATPALSEDGRHVAFLAAGALRPQVAFNSGLDAFVTDMSPGVTRKAGTRELTRDPLNGSPNATGPIDAVAISADGRRIAFTSSRTAFVLPSPRFADTPRQTGSGDELYLADLNSDTIERVVRTPTGGDQDGGELPRLSLDAAGTTAAYLSTSGNLIVGDANAVTDAFASSVVPPAPPPGVPAGVGRRPSNIDVTSSADRELSVSPKRRKDGGVDLRISTPGIGRVSATGTAPKTKKAKKATVLATAKAKVPTSRKVTLALKPHGATLTRVRRGTKVKVKVAVTFTPATGKAVKHSLSVTFAKTAKTAKKPKKAKKARHR